jgi:YtkA-like
MKRAMAMMAVATVLVGGELATTAWTAELKVMQTQKTKDAVIALKSETGQWKPGKNAFVLEFTSPSGQPLDAGKVTLSTSMAMPGMAPMVAGASLSPDKAPGRYLGTIDFPDSGTRQVTVSWDGPAGKGTAKFSVPVR